MSFGWSTAPAVPVPVSAAAQAPRVVAPASNKATRPQAPPPRPRVPVAGQPAVFAWLPHAGRSQATATGAVAVVKPPRFRWAKAPPGIPA